MGNWRGSRDVSFHALETAVKGVQPHASERDAKDRLLFQVLDFVRLHCLFQFDHEDIVPLLGIQRDGPNRFR
jgi:hypothetical protein